MLAEIKIRTRVNEILHVRNFIYTRTEIPPRTDERKKPCPTPTKAVFGLSANSRSATNVKSLHDGHAGLAAMRGMGKKKDADCVVTCNQHLPLL